MADVKDLKVLVDTYGVGVRAGTITPQSEDEDYFRTLAGFPPMSDQARADWAATGNIRKPLTLVKAEVETETPEGE